MCPAMPWHPAQSISLPWTPGLLVDKYMEMGGYLLLDFFTTGQRPVEGSFAQWRHVKVRPPEVAWPDWSTSNCKWSPSPINGTLDLGLSQEGRDGLCWRIGWQQLSWWWCWSLSISIWETTPGFVLNKASEGLAVGFLETRSMSALSGRTALDGFPFFASLWQLRICLTCVLSLTWLHSFSCDQTVPYLSPTLSHTLDHVDWTSVDSNAQRCLAESIPAKRRLFNLFFFYLIAENTNGSIAESKACLAVPVTNVNV